MSTLPQCTVHYTVCTAQAVITVKLDVKSSSLGLRLKTGRLTTMGVHCTQATWAALYCMCPTGRLTTRAGTRPIYL